MGIKFHILLFVIYLLYIPHSLYAQQEIAHFQDFTVKDGLSNTNVTTFFQDSRGIIWIATAYGLNSYDGSVVNSYTNVESGLCHDYIQDITEDGKGNLWIMAGDFARLDYCYSILDPLENKVYSIEEYTGEACPFDPKLTTLNQNFKGTFLLKEHQENDIIQFYEVSDDKIERGFTLRNEDPFLIPPYPMGTLKLDKESYLFAAPKEKKESGLPLDFFILKRSGKILKYRPESKLAEHAVYFKIEGQHLYFWYIHFDDPNHYPNPIPVSIYKDGELLAKTKILYLKEQYPLLSKENILKFYPTHIDKYYPAFDSLIHEQRIPFEKKQILSEKRFIDKDGNLWLAGDSNVRKLSFLPNNFKKSLHEPIDGELYRPVRGIDSNSKGTIYAGGLLGLFSRHSEKPNSSSKPFHIKRKFNEGSLGVLYDDQKLWVGEEHSGLSFYNLKTQEHIYLGSGLIWRPYKAPDGTIWAGAGEGLFKLDKSRKELIPFSDYGAFQKLEKSSIYFFYTNKKGTWLATSSGLYLLDLSQEKILGHYSKTRKGSFYLPTNDIEHIHEDKEGVFWLASKGQGLIRWNPNTGENKQLTSKNTGLSNDVIHAVYEDDFGNLWLPSNYGLNCFNKTSEQVSIYLKEDGLPHNEFSTISHHQDKEGNLYFGTKNGMIEFHPKDFNHEEVSIPLIISSANRINQKTDHSFNITKSVLDNHSLTIKPEDKAAVISFALLNYKKKDGNQYSFKLSGYKDEWTFQKDGEVRLSGLPYGKYQLLLRGKTSGSSTWIEYPHPINIKVTKPFYLRWWFVFSLIALLIGFVFYLLKRNTRILMERQQELEEIVNERTEEIRLQAQELKELDKVKSNFFANISHELRTPLTLILGPLSYILEHTKEWKPEVLKKQLFVMQRNSKSLMALIEEILDLSKLDANKLELQEEHTSIHQFFEYLFFVFEPQFQSKDLDYELILNIKDGLHVLLDRKKLEKVCNNFLSNAIKFTPKKGKITLSVSESTNDLQITVSDTGNGIHPRDLPHIFERFYQSKQVDQKRFGGTGIGLSLVSEYAKLMDGKVNAESTLGVGSKFFFKFPKKEVSVERSLPFIYEENGKQEDIDTIGTDFTILIVEDNLDMRNFIFQLLQNKYKKIILTKNGTEGLDVLKEQGTNIDLIVSDVMMPQMDGLSLLKEVKNHPEWYQIPVIMLTALAAERDKLQALTFGVDDYLTKPFSVPELLTRVQNILYNYHQRKLWQQQENPVLEVESLSQKNSEPITKEIPEVPLGHNHKEWIEGLKKFVEDSLGKNKIDTQVLANSIFISQRQLNRKIKSITGFSTAKFIKEVQLQSARRKLENGAFISIAEVAYNHGYEYPSTFSKAFKDRFGKSPKEYSK